MKKCYEKMPSNHACVLLYREGQIEGKMVLVSGNMLPKCDPGFKKKGPKLFFNLQKFFFYQEVQIILNGSRG